MMQAKVFYFLPIFVVFVGAIRNKRGTAIVFPNLNIVPSKSVTQHLNFLKATKSVHYAAERLLDLSQDEGKRNWIVSPVSLAAVLGQLMLGARGDFHRILGEILSPGKITSSQLPGLDVHKELGSLLNALQDNGWSDYLLNIKSALFLQPDIQLKLSYKHALSDIYNVNVFRTNFSGQPENSRKEINAWVDKATLGKISNILPMALSPATASIYVNTVYFKGSWRNSFDPQLTLAGLFSVNATHQVPVDFMLGEIEVKYLVDDACKCTMVGIPYTDANIFLYIFLPDKDPSGSHYRLFDNAANLTLDRMADMISMSETQNVTITLPKVKLSSTPSLRRPMVRAINRRKDTVRVSNSIRDTRDTTKAEPDEDLGLYLSNSFVPLPTPLPLLIQSGSPSEKHKITFNMGSASDDYRFKIDDVLHQVQMEINEKGSEVVAVSTTIVDYFGSPIVKVNRPFLFLIRHEYTGAHLFWGAVYDPTNAV